MSTQQKNKPRLGRGLSSLISISELPVEAEVPAKPSASAPPAAAPPSQPAATSPTELPISQIQPNPHQPRRSFDDASLTDLAASIKSTGLIQPILVRKVGQQLQLIAGERRLRAAKLAGLTTIPALIRDIDTVTQAQMALIENIQRQDLNPIDRAQGYRTLIQQLGLTQAEMAGRLGEDRSSIANFLRLLDLGDSIKTMVRDGRLSVGHAKLIAGITDVSEQERLANLVLLQGLSVRNLERAIKEGPRPQTSKPAPAGPAAHLQDLEKNISRQLGLRVQLRAAAKKGKGRLVIHYASLDQFDELLTRLKVSTE
jgi:ParB family chromosome partitioning protein